MLKVLEDNKAVKKLVIYFCSFCNLVIVSSPRFAVKIRGNLYNVGIGKAKD